MESIPEQARSEMVDKEIVNQVRTTLIQDLKESIRIYTVDGTKEWVGEQTAKELIEKLKNKLPIVFPAGELWAPDHAIVVGQRIDYGDPRFKEIVRVITEGEVN